MNRLRIENELIRASAGSGKTHQLTNRYLALLAAGAQPDAILATTFTRKAAGEILDRVLERLALAAADPQAAKELAVQIAAEHDRSEDFAALLRRLLHNLHRVRVGTLDSFFIAVAGSFRFELGLPASWSICEEADDAALREETLERLLDEGDADTLVKLYHRLTRAQAQRDVHSQLLAIVAGIYGVYQDAPPDVWAKVQSPPGLAPAELNRLLAQIEAFDLSQHKRMEKPRGEDLERFRAADWDGLHKKGLSAKVFAGENTFYSKPIPPDLIALYNRLLGHARSMLVGPLAEQTRATGQFLQRFDERLRALKQATGALRFDEVTRALVGALHKPRTSAAALAFRMDGAIEHLLLDEFQDTSLAQWRVVQPLARGITQAPSGPPRSFFCVGDDKQAIYGWRDGLPEIFAALPDLIGPLGVRELDESRRSAKPIITAVNQVFQNLGQWQAGDKCLPGVVAWNGRFKKHSTVKRNEPGYVRLATGPAQNGRTLADQRREHCASVASETRELVQQISGRTVGILCRKNDTVARMIYELRRLGVEASEEGGSPLTDSPAVELMLSLLMLADHPGHSIAWFHLRNSPLAPHVAEFPDADALAGRLRRELLTAGYGLFVHRWATLLAPACDRRDLGRLQQLVETAYDFQARSTLRASALVNLVRQTRVPDPSSANVRVMTVHAAKGLQFDAVILPELDAQLIGKPPSVVVGRDSKSLDVNFVCRYADGLTQSLLSQGEQQAFADHRRRQVEESLSLLYVAMTRAIHALYMYIPGPREPKSERKDAWYNLLRQTLAPNATWAESTILYSDGDPDWRRQPAGAQAPPAMVQPALPEHIAFRSEGAAHRRGLERMAPSAREGQATVATDRLFQPGDGLAAAAGTLYHAWFALIGWLDDGAPTDVALRAEAKRLEPQLASAIHAELDGMIARFRGWLADPAISLGLRRSAYKTPQQAGFPSALARFWTDAVKPELVERERRFLVPEGSKLWTGSLDRIVWLSAGGRIVAADVLDFKTDAIEPADAATLRERTDYYRPQLTAYRQAVARMAALPEERIAARLVFTIPKRIVDV